MIIHSFKIFESLLLDWIQSRGTSLPANLAAGTVAGQHCNRILAGYVCPGMIWIMANSLLHSYWMPKK